MKPVPSPFAGKLLSSKTKKYLAISLLLVLAACAPGQSHVSTPLPAPASLYPAYPPGTGNPESILPPTFRLSGEPTIPVINTPTLLPLPSPTVTTTVEAVLGLRLAQLRMLDANTGWAVQMILSNSPMVYKILRTEDGWRTWANVSPPWPEGHVNNLTASFVDANTAVVVYDWQSLPTSKIEVTTWRTRDGGHTWQAGQNVQSPIGVVEGLEVMMLNPDQGWLLGIRAPAMYSSSLRFFETQDGGVNWDMVYDAVEHLSDPEVLWLGVFYPYSEKHFTFLPDHTGFFSDGRKLSNSKDGGRTWIARPLDPPAGYLDIDCHSSDCKYLDTISTPEFSSSKEGMLLRRVYRNSEKVMNSFLYGDELNELPQAQFIYFTQDGGKTWTPKPIPLKIGTVSFVDAQTGWLLGKNDPDPATPTELYQTTDAGETWTQISAACPLPLGGEIQFADGKAGFAIYPFSAFYYYRDFDARTIEAAQTSSLFYTRDGGHSWAKADLQVIP